MASGLGVLDVACGHGCITRELQGGAQKLPARYLRAADRWAQEIEQNERLGICSIHADVTALRALGGRKFDLVSCNFGLSGQPDPRES
jgi:ubiquinone/menaquinone biosynthesis C-methylase UbiE